jgi:hypothetical protein
MQRRILYCWNFKQIFEAFLALLMPGMRRQETQVVNRFCQVLYPSSDDGGMVSPCWI